MPREKIKMQIVPAGARLSGWPNCRSQTNSNRNRTSNSAYHQFFPRDNVSSRRPESQDSHQDFSSKHTLKSNDSPKTESQSSPRNNDHFQKAEMNSLPDPPRDPPKTISPKKRIILDEFPFKINEGIEIFYEEIEDSGDLTDNANSEQDLLSNGSEDNSFDMNDIESKFKRMGAYPRNFSKSCLQKINSEDVQPKNVTIDVNTNHNDNVQRELNINRCGRTRAKLLEMLTRKQAKVLEQSATNPQKESDDTLDNVNRGVEENKCNLDQCQCKDCDNFINCPTWCDRNTAFVKPPNSKNGSPFFKRSTSEKKPEITKKIDNKILLHGPVIPKAVFSLKETFIDDHIQDALRTLDIDSAKNIQSYMWPSIQRGLSAFMIAPPETGKTMSYLPVFCSFCLENNERYAELTKYDGPLVIILCPDNQTCSDLKNVAKTLTSGCAAAVKVSVLSDEDAFKDNCNCDILITTPPNLEESLKRGTVTLKRLCHLAIESAHTLLRQYSSSLGKLLNAINLMQKNRPHNKNIQVVVTSEKWSVDLDILLKNLYTVPVVCFEDFLEAVNYSEILFKRKKLKPKIKIFYAIDVLKRQYMTHKTVLFCDEDDIPKVREFLEVSGVECIELSNKLSEDEMLENEDMWSSLSCGYYKVLLRTDSVFEQTVKVANAQWLIHYSLPKDWDHFQKRFKCLSADLTSPLEREDHSTPKCSYIIIDELCDNQLFLDFIEIWTRNQVPHLKLQ